MNNIGGIIQCEILNVDDIVIFAVFNQNAEIKTKETANWQLLPISQKNTSVSAQPSTDDAGTLYEHKFSTIIPKPAQEDIIRYRSLCLSGCIIRYTDSNGNKRVLGTKDYPLTGTLAEVPGQTASELAGYKLTLQASELTPQLSYSEI